MVVLTVSMGMSTIRNAAAAADANMVLTPMFMSRVASRWLTSVRIPVLAAVSPNRLRGPWTSAGKTPR
jgi:hypothetical protein